MERMGNFSLTYRVLGAPSVFLNVKFCMISPMRGPHSNQIHRDKVEGWVPGAGRGQEWRVTFQWE